MSITRNIRTTLEMIKIEHTLFALPFAFLGAVLAARGIPTAAQILWITLAMAGARILPASPGFYHRPQTIEALVDHLVFRILDQFGIPHSTATRWKGETSV